MQTRQVDSLFTYRTAQQTLDEYDALLGPVNTSGVRLEFDTLVAKLGEQAVSQMVHNRAKSGEMYSLAASKKRLREHHINPIVTIARMLKRTIPQLTGVVAPPARTKTQQLVTNAHSLANTVEPYADRFIYFGLDPDFVNQLRAAADEVADVNVSRGAEGGGQVGATAGIAATIRDADTALRALDALVVRYGGHNAEFMAQWRSARRLPAHAVSAAPALGSEMPSGVAIAKPDARVLGRVETPKALGPGSGPAMGSVVNPGQGVPEPRTLLSRVFRRFAGG